MIPPDAQRAMSKRAGSTVAEVKGSHAVYVSQPKAVAALIRRQQTVWPWPHGSATKPGGVA